MSHLPIMKFCHHDDTVLQTKATVQTFLFLKCVNIFPQQLRLMSATGTKPGNVMSYLYCIYTRSYRLAFYSPLFQSA